MLFIVKMKGILIVVDDIIVTLFPAVREQVVSEGREHVVLVIMNYWGNETIRELNVTELDEDI